MKKFILLTAISEGLTGIALIAIPNIIVLFLLGKPTYGPEGKITAMMAGTAILSLAGICWILRNSADIRKLVKGMLFYNCVIIAIAIYALFGYGITNMGLWFVIFSHTILGVWGVITLLVKRFSNV